MEENHNHICSICGAQYTYNEYEQFLEHQYEHDNHSYEEAYERGN